MRTGLDLRKQKDLRLVPCGESDYMRSLLSAGDYSAPRCNRGGVLTNLTFFTDPIDP